MKLRLGQEIKIEGVAFTVVGVLLMHTYTNYYVIDNAGQHYSLDDCRGWRLWRKITCKSAEQFMFKLIKKSGIVLGDLIGSEEEKLQITIRAIGFESAGQTEGDVDEIEEGEIVFYCEGTYLEPREFNLFVAEMWGDEVETSEGKVVVEVTF
jgi:hypothetical protein